ncbi:hypothetical protein BGX23_002383 [Mortierella sp. AD031]|nr:hypothetical protein BGX23_002383 [Mortierella sp. AD031]
MAQSQNKNNAYKNHYKNSRRKNPRKNRRKNRRNLIKTASDYGMRQLFTFDKEDNKARFTKYLETNYMVHRNGDWLELSAEGRPAWDDEGGVIAKAKEFGALVYNLPRHD